MNESRIVFLNEFQVFIKRNPSAMINVDLVEIPFHHLLRNWDVQWLKGIFHQFSELANVDQIVFATLRVFFRLLGSLSEKVGKLDKQIITYSSNVMDPSWF